MLTCWEFPEENGEIRSRASRLTFGQGDNQLLVTRGGVPPGDTVVPSPYGLPPQEAREKLKSLTLTHFADDKLNHRGSGPGLEPERMIRPVLPAHGPGTAGPSVGPSPGRSPSRSRAPETQRTACPRLSPPLGSTERHVPGTHGDAPTSQDWGGVGVGVQRARAGGRWRGKGAARPPEEKQFRAPQPPAAERGAHYRLSSPHPWAPKAAGECTPQPCSPLTPSVQGSSAANPRPGWEKGRGAEGRAEPQLAVPLGGHPRGVN